VEWLTEDGDFQDKGEEVASMGSDVELLLYLPKQSYPIIAELLDILGEAHDGRWSLIAGIQADLENHPNHFPEAKEILMKCLDTESGFDVLGFTMLEVFDLFSTDERARIIEEFTKRGSRIAPVFRVIDDIIDNKPVSEYVAETAFKNIDTFFETTGFTAKMDTLTRILTRLSLMLPEFQSFQKKL
jgi:hypothetical protein